MTTKTKPRTGWHQARPKTSDSQNDTGRERHLCCCRPGASCIFCLKWARSALRATTALKPSLRHLIKGATVRRANAGLLSAPVAEWLIRRGGLRDA